MMNRSGTAGASPYSREAVAIVALSVGAAAAFLVAHFVFGL